MNWRKLFSPSDAAAAANASDVTDTNDALYGGGGNRGGVDTPAAPDGSDPHHLPEEVKRRQVALLLRYVMTIRVR